MTHYSLRHFATVVGTALLLALAAPSFAGDSAKQASTAASHAGFAAKSPDIKQVHMHLHHAVNCLVGPDGEGFDANQVNPCATMGNGAIPDASDSAMKEKLEHALAMAQSGLDSEDLTEAKEHASKTEAALK